ncbi:basement membrane-specific heparan sulfate proteoglycan core protein-like isoform X2 [Notolabrus celidotus]|uniref:basement membrane-specific heparan sulfate proteoglycan core protein-like isoform X2 n=1 Tax=Notolabrus celidotus TaxID=1203425 RepID=UPI0014902CF9|nr:basement membrane-specific heparan sulfate proteoglycan core protein-like isoform X2 [Notolabrus celidotus]
MRGHLLQVVSRENGWGVAYSSHQICALKGSTVDISCTYTYQPRMHELVTKVEETLWFTKLDGNQSVDLRTDPDYTGRLEYHSHEKDCTLRIKDLRESDSAEYKFRFTTNQTEETFTGSPGVTLTVTDLRVHVERVSTQAELRCHSSCTVADNPSYIWYRDGQKMAAETSSLSVPVNVNKYTCAIKGHEDHHSPAVLLQGWRVTYPSLKICALKGSTVDIPCTYTYPLTIKHQTTEVQSRLWFINTDSNEPVDLRTKSSYSGRVEYHFNENDCTLRIKDLRESDSAEYKFKFTTNQEGGSVTGAPGVTLNVTDMRVQVNRSSTKTKLRCHSNCNVADSPSYVWYRNGKKIAAETSSLQVYVHDFNNYSCAFKGHEDYSSTTVYPPKLPSVSVSPVEEGSSVNLTCSSDANPAANYSWYREKSNNNHEYLKRGPQFAFRSIQLSDSGGYYCQAENELGLGMSRVLINVKYGPKTCSVSLSTTAEINENKSVTLTCSSNGYPTPEFTWYKQNDRGHHSKGSELTFSSIQSSDSGRYYCEAKNELGRKTCGYNYITVKYAPKPPSVSASPSAEIVEDSSMILTCSSHANPPATYTWYKKTGTQGHKPLNTRTQLYFKSIKASDSGEYYCTVENKLGSKTSGSISINVIYAPKPLTISVNPSGEVLEGNIVNLTCSSDANPAATYTWYKDMEKLDLQHPRDGSELVFSSIQSSDSGEYHCRAVNNLGWMTSEHVSMDVKYAPRLPSASLNSSAQIIEGKPVTLTCSSDANPAATYTWYRKNGNLGHQSLTPTSQHFFRSIQSSDSGEYYCTAENRLGNRTSESIFIDVKYAPRPLTVSMDPSREILEGKAVVLKCSSDANPAASYTWYKMTLKPNHDPLRNGSELVFSSIQSSDSGRYYCEAKNKLGRRTSGSTYINVKYAPRLPSVSASPSAEIMENSSMILTCSSDANPAATYTWYKKNAAQGHEPLNTRTQHYFKSIKASDSGEYYCTVGNMLGNKTSGSISINVKYAPKLLTISVNPSGEVLEGNTVILTCSSDAIPAANYTWYKKMAKLDLQHPREGSELVFSSIQSTDSGEYHCRAENILGWTTSEDVSIDVKYAPKPPSVSASPSAEIVEDSSMILTCSSEANPAATYTWYKKTGTQGHKPLNTRTQLYFKSIKASDSGEYYCTVGNKLGSKTSGSISINVIYAPKPLTISVSPSGEVLEGNIVTLTCSSDANPAATYTWHKDMEKVDLQHPRDGSELVFSSIQSSDSGEYHCRAVNNLGWMTSEHVSIDVKYAPKLPSVSVSPSAEIVEGTSVNLTCRSDANPAANYTWYKENEDSPKSWGQIFTISHFRAEHSGNYYCEAQNTRGRHNSILHLIEVAGNSTLKTDIIRLTLVLLILIPLLFLILEIRKKKILNFTAEPNEPEEMVELDSGSEYRNVSAVTAAQIEHTKEQEDTV